MSINALTWGEFFGGIILLFVGGEILVRGSVMIARKMGVSPLLIGATVVAFGTSAPELVVSISAAAQGVVDIAIGNVLGSNLANLLLILGITVILCPIFVNRRSVSRELLSLGLATCLVTGLAFIDILPRYAGILMVLALSGYVAYSYWSESSKQSIGSGYKQDTYSRNIVEQTKGSFWFGGALLVSGIAGVVIGAYFLVESGTTIARAAGISEAVIGLTVVAFGTSLPELVTSLVAAIKRHGDVALGNILGSSLFNILGILGAVAIVQPAPIPSEIRDLDVWVVLGATTLVLLIIFSGWRLGRVIGLFLIAIYSLYVIHHYV
tara:strand:- start:929 stop:1897 length:969 start_codon:yes stop_codon:yes gene_type:complete